ncbi:hypothetical protein D3C83_140730 [compost metagenome]
MQATGLRLRSTEVLGGNVVGLLEELASQAYGQAGRAVPEEAARRPGSVRRLLTLISDRYLFPFAADWLPRPAI